MSTFVQFTYEDWSSSETSVSSTVQCKPIQPINLEGASRGAFECSMGRQAVELMALQVDRLTEAARHNVGIVNRSGFRGGLLA